MPDSPLLTFVGNKQDGAAPAGLITRDIRIRPVLRREHLSCHLADLQVIVYDDTLSQFDYLSRQAVYPI